MTDGLVATHASLAELEAGLDHVRASPIDGGRLELLVRRPDLGLREVLDEGRLDPVEGLVGDSWCRRPSTRSADGGPHPEMQLNVMNARVAALVARQPQRWSLAGDQLYVDLQLGYDTLPPGTRLSVGTAVVEITPQPHRGCVKFSARFGPDALRFVNSAAGRDLNLRGVNAKVVVAGLARPGDLLRRIDG